MMYNVGIKASLPTFTWQEGYIAQLLLCGLCELQLASPVDAQRWSKNRPMFNIGISVYVAAATLLLHHFICQ